MNYKEDFLDFCQYQRGLADNSIRGYRYDLTEFFQWIQGRGVEVEKVKVRDIDPFIIFLRKDRGNTVGSVNRKMYCLKMFFKWLMRMEVIEKNPLEFFQNIKAPKRLPKFLTLEQQEALLNAAHGGPEDHRAPWLKARDYLMVLTFTDLGLRASELCGILVKDIDLKEGTIRIIGKGDRERICILSDRVRQTIRDYLKLVSESNLESGGPLLASRGTHLWAIARSMNLNATSAGTALYYGRKKGVIEQIMRGVETAKTKPIEFLFFNARGVPLGSRHVFRLVRDIGKLAGIEGLHPHLLRHSYATNLRRKRADLLLIKEALGHASVNTTEIYAHIENQEYMERMRELVN